MLGFTNANPVRTPSLAKLPEGSDEKLDDSETSLFRSCTGILLYLQHDRADLHYDVNLLSSALSSPTVGDMARLKRVGRYLRHRPVAGNWLPRRENEPPHKKKKFHLDIYTDSNRASTETKRKSLSSMVAFIDGAPAFLVFDGKVQWQLPLAKLSSML